MARIQACKKPMILVDGLSARFGIKAELNALVTMTGFPTLTTPYGKSIIKEDLVNFHDVHLGSVGEVAHQTWIAERDLVLHFCPLNSDANTFGFTTMPDPNSTITFDYNSVRMSAADEKTANGRVIPIKSALSKLLERLRTTKIPTPDRYPEKCLSLKSMLKHLPKPAESSIFDQYSFWLVVFSFLRLRDVVMTETGTAAYGGQSLILPEDTVLINSCIWLSIGYML
ncbi:pyruvate decarboxylase [Colletotrichum liriopes]|uniref:Pyruvate decarboxylase n=1 Tax=Colletotrichum liriopes TaxID=708192 RepID=A0AA37GWD9_9PEZI|nr:pyruvate decarboxylase [Colletotrichum liriopes]